MSFFSVAFSVTWYSNTCWIINLNYLTEVFVEFDIYQNQAVEAELETEKAYKQIDKLKRKHERDISAWKQLLAESRLPKEAIEPVYDDDCNTTKYDGVEPDTTADQHWRDEFKPFYISEEESTRLAEPSWFSGYDRCNV